MKKLQIGIIGYAGKEEYPKDVNIKDEIYQVAYEVGKSLAKRGCTIVTGGKSGVMKEANRGCQEGCGISVGVVTGNERFTSNNFVDVEVVPGMYNCGEEMCLVTMCDALVVLGGGAGTLQELIMAYRMSKPLFTIKGLGGWSGQLEDKKYLDQRKRSKLEVFESVEELVEGLMNQLKLVSNDKI